MRASRDHPETDLNRATKIGRFLALGSLSALTIACLPSLDRPAFAATERFECLTAKPVSAVEICRSAIQSTPEDVDLHVVLGAALTHLHRYEEALAAYQDATTRFPWHEGLIGKLNVVQSILDEKEWMRGRQGRVDCLKTEDESAIEICRTAILSAPDDPALFLALGAALTRANRLDQALALYHDAVARFPSHEELAGRLAAAQSVAREQDWMDPRLADEPALETQEADNLAIAMKSAAIRCACLTGQVALEACEAGLAMDSSSAELHVGRGDALISLGRAHDAINAYEAALRRDPDNFPLADKVRGLKRSLEAESAAPTEMATPNVEVAVRPLAAPPAAATQDNSDTAEVSADEPVAAEVTGVADAAHADPSESGIAPAPPIPQGIAEPTNEPVDRTSVASAPMPASNTFAAADHTPVTNAPANTAVEFDSRSQEFLERLALLRAIRNRGDIDDAEFERRRTALLDTMFPAADGDPPANQQDDPLAALGDVEFGAYYALVIGNNGYQFLPELDTAETDAIAVAEILEQRYGFSVRLLLNATRRDVLMSLSELRRTLSSTDSLLIYYAGHGALDTSVERGYWLPVDAEEGFKANWISNADITDSLRATDALHALIVADSCYSGTLVRGLSTPANRSGSDRIALISRLAARKSRTVMTSGGLEPVVDSGGGGHSVFAAAFLDVLRDNDGIVEGQTLFSALRDKVVVNADQTPEYAIVHKAGHDGGDFIFVARD